MTGKRHYFEECVRVGDELWFSSATENALCTKNVTTGKFKIVYQFKAPPRAIRLHSRVFYEQGVLYFVPANADALAAYWIKDKKCRYFDVPKLRVYGIKEGAPFYHFESAVQIGRRIYMFSLLSPEITVFDMDKETMETVYVKELDNGNGAYHHTFGRDAAVWEGKLYLAVYSTVKLLEIDVKSLDYRILEYSDKTASFCCMAQDKDTFYIVDNANADLICFQTRAGRFELLSRGFIEPDIRFTFIKGIFRNQKLYLFQNYADCCYIYDTRSRLCMAVDVGVCPPKEEHLFCEERMESKYYGFWRTGEGICFYYAPFDTVFLLNEKGKLTDIPFFNSQERRMLNMQRLWKAADADVYMESRPGDLELFIGNISQNPESPGIGYKMTVGEEIYRAAMKGMGRWTD